MRYLIFTIALFWAGAAAAACDGPYKAVRTDGRCVWSCAAGTAPDAARGECTCKAGHRETSKDRFGRRQCEADSAKGTGQKKAVKRYGARHPFNTAPVNLCARFARDDTPGWPVACGTRPGRVQLRVLRPQEIIVRRSAPMTQTEFVPGSYQFSFPRPKPPKRLDGVCDEALISSPGACRAKCERMEMYAFFDDGNIAELRRADHGQIGRCEGPVTMTYRVGKPTAARAWDACVDGDKGRSTQGWGHDARIEIPRRVAADFGFRDARTVQTSDGWRYVAKVNHVIRDATVKLPIIVHCRP
ncbi:hypothetical protein [Roseovarius pelagicus]|uniref:Uncharacterized protein n=1 Tax=Roseovarius pelagicus TaxID=2980108 RepID=A0ABY6DD54_9RHOB|nr:hypothetical protein [Roseovarius pelagicus]UXX83133.1 hypothetical protein N7U68_18975 [Roseovarius pelagicus]